MSDKATDKINAALVADGADEEPIEANRRLFTDWRYLLIASMAALYAAFHMAALNGLSLSGLTGIELAFLPSFPMETWNFRIVHIAGALFIGFLMFSSRMSFVDADTTTPPVLTWLSYALLLAALLACAAAVSFAMRIADGAMWNGMAAEYRIPEIYWFGLPLLVATFGAIILGWFDKTPRHRFSLPDIVLGVCGLAVAIYLITMYGTLMRNSTGTPFAPIGISLAAVAGTALIMELTRRVTGMALITIAAVFLVYVFVGHLAPGFLNSPQIDWTRFFSQVYTDAGILGPTTAVSSTYIILFIIFAAFLQASKVGDYFINFAFAAAGRTRGGPAKVSIFASGLMGMINGTSAGNVVATGSLTIPLMKKVGYPRKTAGAVEAAASTGGQIMPPIMGAGAFIMAEITGIPYTDIAVAAIIPAVLYFVSVYFMVDFEAAKLGMRGMRDDELPNLKLMLRQVYLFLPIIILIYALFAGYSVIRAGTLATVAAAMISWLTPYRMGLRSVSKAFELAGVMSIQIIAVCACAGIIVGVISLTGVGARFSSLLLGIADTSQLLALFFAMCIAILLGMGMPTTAAYAVAASVVAPGLVQLGIPLLTAQPWYSILRAAITAIFGVFLLSCGVQGWFMGQRAAWFIRVALIAAALFMIEGGLVSDGIGIALAAASLFIQRVVKPKPNATVSVRGAD